MEFYTFTAGTHISGDTGVWDQASNFFLGGEIYHQTATNILGKDSTGFNLGGVYDVDEHNHLLFSAGRAFQNANETNLCSWYLAWQITY
jgi:hypothetical protein